MVVYHIVLPEKWAEFEAKAEYEAESLHTEGFIHCSFAEQIDGVLQRYYSGFDEVLVLTIDEEKLTSPLVREPSTDSEVYPHIYGPINIASITAVRKMRLPKG